MTTFRLLTTSTKSMLTIFTITKPSRKNNLPILVFEGTGFLDDFGEIGSVKPETYVSSKYVWKRFLKDKAIKLSCVFRLEIITTYHLRI